MRRRENREKARVMAPSSPLNSDGETVRRAWVPRARPGMEAAISRAAGFQSTLPRSSGIICRVMQKPTRQMRGTAWIMGRTRASSGRATSAAPNPVRPWTIPATKMIRMTKKNVIARG